MSPIACGSCGGNKVKAAATLRWTVDLSPVPDAEFSGPGDKKKRTYMTVQEANAAVAALKLQGRVRPRPATVND